MKGYTTNIENDSIANKTFRTVLYTSSYMQLVVMSLRPGEEIGTEKHGQDQFIRIEQGKGKIILNKKAHVLYDGVAVMVPAGMEHNVINSGKDEMKLYTIYATPHHADGIIHRTKKEAERDEKNYADEYLGDRTEK